jgi:glucose/arabinose dehydrogenase
MRAPFVFRSTAARAACAAAAIAAAATAGAQVAVSSTTNPRAAWSEPAETFTSRVVATGLEDPWEVAWGPDGFLWITERVGKRVVRVNPTTGERNVAVTIDEVYQTLAQDGLLGLVLHPLLARGSNYVYVM